MSPVLVGPVFPGLAKDVATQTMHATGNYQVQPISGPFGGQHIADPMRPQFAEHVLPAGISAKVTTPD